MIMEMVMMNRVTLILQIMLGVDHQCIITPIIINSNNNLTSFEISLLLLNSFQLRVMQWHFLTNLSISSNIVTIINFNVTLQP